jgi:hypothetical protein
MQMLQDRAFEAEGKITPATLIRTFGEMQEELRGELRKNPEDPLLRAKVSKLQQSFITTVQSTDYVDVNARRGVDIFDKEPELKAARQAQAAPGTTAPAQDPPPDAEKPGAPKPDGDGPKAPPQAARRPPRLGA